MLQLHWLALQSLQILKLVSLYLPSTCCYLILHVYLFSYHVVLLIYYQGPKYRDAAEVLSIPEGTVKSRMHAAIHKLRRILAEEADEHLR